jgi:hypothetical protein
MTVTVEAWVVVIIVCGFVARPIIRKLEGKAFKMTISKLFGGTVIETIDNVPKPKQRPRRKKS